MYRDYLLIHQQSRSPMHHWVPSHREECRLHVDVELITELQAHQRSHHLSETGHFSYLWWRFAKQNLVVLTVNYAKRFAWGERLTLWRDKLAVDECHWFEPTGHIETLVLVQSLVFDNLFCQSVYFDLAWGLFSLFLLQSFYVNYLHLGAWHCTEVIFLFRTYRRSGLDHVRSFRILLHLWATCRLYRYARFKNVIRSIYFGKRLKKFFDLNFYRLITDVKC